MSFETVWTYHARVHGLRPDTTYGYAVTADNDGNATEAMEQFRSARANIANGDLEQNDPPVFGRLGEISVPASLLAAITATLAQAGW